MFDNHAIQKSSLRPLQPAPCCCGFQALKMSWRRRLLCGTASGISLPAPVSQAISSASGFVLQHCRGILWLLLKKKGPKKPLTKHSPCSPPTHCEPSNPMQCFWMDQNHRSHYCACVSPIPGTYAGLTFLFLHQLGALSALTMPLQTLNVTVSPTRRRLHSQSIFFPAPVRLDFTGVSPVGRKSDPRIC